MKPRRCPHLTLAAMLLAAAGLSGCVTSEASRYQRTISSSVSPEQRASADVAREFGLRTEAAPQLSLGEMDE